MDLSAHSDRNFPFSANFISFMSKSTSSSLSQLDADFRRCAQIKKNYSTVMQNETKYLFSHSGESRNRHKFPGLRFSLEQRLFTGSSIKGKIIFYYLAFFVTSFF
jgi:hypothetical protein